jgi:hypothetical protein
MHSLNFLNLKCFPSGGNHNIPQSSSDIYLWLQDYVLNVVLENESTPNTLL